MFGNLTISLADLSLGTLNGFYDQQNDKMPLVETTNQVNGLLCEERKDQFSNLSSSDLIQMKEQGSIDSKSDLKKSIELNIELAKNRLEDTMPITAKEINTFYHLFFNTKFKEQAISQGVNPYHPATVINQLHEAVLASQSSNPSLKMQPTNGNEFTGINASYFLLGLTGQKLWVYKPAKGESGYEGKGTVLMEGIKPGEGIIREKLASLLNYHKKFPIPYTTCINLNGEMGSAQAFQSNCLTFTELLSEIQHQDKIAKIPLIQLQAISVFDLIFYNGDRHLGNILFRKDTDELVAIDHGACMTMSLKDPLKMEYLALPQMNQPYSEEIQRLITEENDIERNANEMQRLGIGDKAIQWMKSASSLLKTAIQLSNEHQEKLKEKKLDVYLSPTDIALLIMTHVDIREKLLGMDSHADYIKDILAAKTYIQENLRDHNIDLNEAPEDIAQQALKKLRMTVFRRAWNSRAEWLNSLFTELIPNYIRTLSQNKSKSQVNENH